MVIATAGFKIPNELADAAIPRPITSEPPMTAPDNDFETLSYTAAAIPIPNTIAPIISAKKTIVVTSIVPAGIAPNSGTNNFPIYSAASPPIISQQYIQLHLLLKFYAVTIIQE